MKLLIFVIIVVVILMNVGKRLRRRITTITYSDTEKEIAKGLRNYYLIINDETVITHIGSQETEWWKQEKLNPNSKWVKLYEASIGGVD